MCNENPLNLPVYGINRLTIETSNQAALEKLIKLAEGEHNIPPDLITLDSLTFKDGKVRSVTKIDRST